MASSDPVKAVPPRWIAILPNALTCARLGLAVAVPFADRGALLWIVLAAGASDFLDGAIARRFHASTHLGALLDGIADKVFVLVVLLTLAAASVIGWWQVPLVLARDLTVAVRTAVLVARRQWKGFRDMVVRMPGKLTTAVLFGWFAALLVVPLEPLRLPLFAFAAALSVVAAVDYAVQAVRLARRRREDPEAPPSRASPPSRRA